MEYEDHVDQFLEESDTSSAAMVDFKTRCKELQLARLLSLQHSKEESVPHGSTTENHLSTPVKPAPPDSKDEWGRSNLN